MLMLEGTAMNCSVNPLNRESKLCDVLPCKEEAVWGVISSDAALCYTHNLMWGAYHAGFTKGSGKNTNVGNRVLSSTPAGWQYRYNQFLEFAKVTMVFEAELRRIDNAPR